MQGISIFQQIYAPRVAHVVTDFDGISHNTHSPYAMGGVVGSVGKMTAIVANDQADTWHIVNLKCGKIFDAVAVLGAFDESEAANMAMRYHGQYFDAVCGDVCESNTGGLQRFLNHPVYMRTNRPVYAEELAKLQDIPSTQAILWDGVQLKSHNGSSKHLLLDMMRCDDDKALLEKMDFVEEESQLDGEIAEYDALVVEAYKLESTVSKLALAMDKATSISTLKVANQTLSKPKTMRGFGVIQQLVSFELSDGQAVSIIFNVSDSEANASAKMTKDDLLVAWKYKLNSRDITAAVQPNATQNVSLNMIASRIMGLADANSEKFVAAQKKKDAMQTELANTNQQVKDLQSQEQLLIQEIADLQKRLDEKAKNAEKEAKSRAEIEGMAKAVQSAHAELDARVDALDARGLGYLGAFLNYNTTDISKIAEKAKLEHPDDLKAALDKLDNAMAQDEVRKKLAHLKDVVFSWDSESEQQKFKAILAQNPNLTQAYNEYFKDNLQGKSVMTSIGKVWITGESRAEMRNRLTQFKAMIIPYVPEILINGKVGKEKANEDASEPKKAKYASFIPFQHTVNVDGLDVLAMVQVGKLQNDGKLAYSLNVNQSQEVFDSANEKAIFSPSQVDQENQQGYRAVKNGLDSITAQDDEEINIEILSIVDKRTGKTLTEDEAEKVLFGEGEAEVVPVEETTTQANNLFAAHDEIAREYGYSVSNDGSILKSNGVATGAVLSIKKGRLIVNGKDKSLLFSGKNPDGLSIFLNTYWYANKKPIVQPTTQQPVQPVSEPPMTNPDRDYLQSIIDGALIPKESDMDTVIELAEKYENDEVITPLLEQALEVINQTQQAAVKGVV